MIDRDTVTQARNTDVIAYLEQRIGYTFKRRGGEYRCKQHPSLAINGDRLSWYWHSRGTGGHGILDYLMKIEHMPFMEAVEAVTGSSAVVAAPRYEADKPKILLLPKKAATPLSLHAYLCGRRGIDGAIVDALIREGKLYEDRRRNVVFVGHDEQGRARFASLRGTAGGRPFHKDCAGSDKRYGFCVESQHSGRLYIYESPIDLMSHATMENMATRDKDAWKHHNRLSLAGTSDTALSFFLSKHHCVRELVFCLDNDQAGREATTSMTDRYRAEGYETKNELPHGKDFNEDLTDMLRMKKERNKDTKSQTID